jgi:hypothetical protein
MRLNRSVLRFLRSSSVRVSASARRSGPRPLSVQASPGSLTSHSSVFRGEYMQKILGKLLTREWVEKRGKDPLVDIYLYDDPQHDHGLELILRFEHSNYKSIRFEGIDDPRSPRLVFKEAMQGSTRRAWSLALAYNHADPDRALAALTFEAYRCWPEDAPREFDISDLLSTLSLVDD